MKSICSTKEKEPASSMSFDIDAEKSNDLSFIANGFCSFFNEIIGSVKKKHIPLRDFVWRKPAPVPNKTDIRLTFCKVTEQEVMKQLRSVKRSKSTGLDDLPTGMLKDATPVQTASLTFLIDLSLKIGLFPTYWKSAKIIPIHKSGSRSSFENYRPISILPVSSMVTDKLIHQQLLTFLEEHKLLSKFQFGFRPKLSTELAATLLLDDIRKYVDDSKIVGEIFVDLTKAFDSISHSKLVEKLPRYSIDVIELECFKDYLFNRSITVKYGNCFSQKKDILTAVPRGSSLGPLLFLIFFNDITDVIGSANMIKYADDTVIYVADESLKKTQTELNKVIIDDVADWLDENELIINLKKGKIESLLFGRANRLAKLNKPFTLSYRGRIIPETKNYKYLGVEIDGSLNLNSHFEKSFKRALGKLLGRLRECLNITSAKAIYLYDLTNPHLLWYIAIKTDESQNNKLLSFHDRAVKTISLGCNLESEVKLPSVIDSNNKRACLLVRKFIDKDIEAQKYHFLQFEH